MRLIKRVLAHSFILGGWEGGGDVNFYLMLPADSSQAEQR